MTIGMKVDYFPVGVIKLFLYQGRILFLWGKNFILDCISVIWKLYNVTEAN